MSCRVLIDRRRGERHDYRWVLRDSVFDAGHFREIRIDQHSPEGRRALARFHSDAQPIMGPAPRWYRLVYDHRLRTMNDRELRRWLIDPAYEPVQQARHRHQADWSWW
jgi:hypothetical protein